MFKSAKEAVEFIKSQNIEIIDLRFMDFPGLWQHFSVPAKVFYEEDPFVEGLGFDGSSIRGWKSINESDMLLVPDYTTAFLDPFTEHKTLVFICDIKDPITGKDYDRDPRHIAKKAEAYLKATGIGDVSYFGSELEFFVFDKAYFHQDSHSGYYFIDSDEAVWNSGNELNLDGTFNKGYKIRHKEGYFPVPPHDSLQDLRSEAIIHLQNIGIEIETHHHEVATAGQGEIDFKFDTLTRTADNVLKVKYVLKNTAWRRGKTVTFMPKPIFGDNGTGMHTHQSIWKGGKNLFAGDKYAGLSQEALWYIGGLLKHAKALAAFTNPSTNSYKRLVPGFEAPINLAYSARNRSAAIRIPVYSGSPKAKRLEYRPADATANPYLAFSAMLMAGIDGIKNRIDPGEPVDKNIYDLPPEEKAKIPQFPGSLEEALKALAEDHEFLLQGDVFTKDVIETWIEYKMEAEVKAIAQRPHPYEFFLYFDV